MYQITSKSLVHCNDKRYPVSKQYLEKVKLNKQEGKIRNAEFLTVSEASVQSLDRLGRRKDKGWGWGA